MSFSRFSSTTNFLIGPEPRIFPAPSIDAIDLTLSMLVVSLFTTANCFQVLRDGAQDPFTTSRDGVEDS